MPWRIITAGNIQGRFTVTESALLQATSGAGNKLQERLVDAIGVFIGAMTAAGYPVLTTGQVPDQLRNHVEAMAVMEWLRDFPGLKVFKTAERVAAAAAAADALKLIVNRNYGAIESPFGPDRTACWNSENKIIGRMHPVPPPEMQFDATGINGPAYANQNAVAEWVGNAAQPAAPVNFGANQYEGAVTLTWLPGPGSGVVTYNIFRGTTPGGESLTPVATGITGTSWTDPAAAVGTTYYYILQAQCGTLTSPLSGELAITVDGGLK